MANLIIVRHAQASLRSSNYDKLSDLGLTQAELLGQYLAKQSFQPARIISGSLLRQRETAQALKRNLSFANDIHVDERWNEFEFKDLLRTFQASKFAEPIKFTPTTEPKIFFKALKKAMLAWSDGKLNTDHIEDWEQFERRISDALSDIMEAVSRNETIILTSSGGAISMALRQILGLDVNRMIDLNFQIKNTSYSNIEIKKNRMVMASFNQTPHLSEDLVSYA